MKVHYLLDLLFKFSDWCCQFGLWALQSCSTPTQLFVFRALTLLCCSTDFRVSSQPHFKWILVILQECRFHFWVFWVKLQAHWFVWLTLLFLHLVELVGVFKHLVSWCWSRLSKFILLFFSFLYHLLRILLLVIHILFIVALYLLWVTPNIQESNFTLILIIYQSFQVYFNNLAQTKWDLITLSKFQLQSVTNFENVLA